MKNIATICLLFLLASCNLVRKSSITPPSEVLAGFGARYAMVSHVRWSLDSLQTYHARFFIDKHLLDAYFDEKGNWLKSEKKIIISELPAVVSQTLRWSFADSRIEKISEVQQPGHEIRYSVLIRKSGKPSRIWLSTGGVILDNPDSR